MKKELVKREVSAVNENTQFCPCCNSDWRGNLIPENQRDQFGNKLFFSRVIGLECPDVYDGCFYFLCPDCKASFNRKSS